MNVLLIHNAGAAGLPSGETIVFEREAQALRDRGWQVQTLGIENVPGLSARLRRANVFWSKSAYRRTWELIRTVQPDVVHVHSVLPSLTVSVFAACHAANVPVVQTLHNYRWICVEGGLFRNAAFCDACLTRGAWSGVLHRCSRNSLVASSLLTLNNQFFVRNGKLQRWVDRFLAVSHYVKDMYVQGGFEESQIDVKYNGVKIEAAVPRDSDSRTVVFAGRLDVAKGTSILVELPRLLSADVRFKIAGAGPAEAMLRSQLGDCENVELLGRLSPGQVRTLMAQASCVIVPSLVPESFGLAAAEAMAQGVPIVASRIGGLSELLTASRGGFAIEAPYQPAAFAAAVQDLLSSNVLRQEMGQRGSDFASRHLSLEKTTDDLLRIYQDVIQCRQKSKPPEAST